MSTCLDQHKRITLEMCPLSRGEIRICRNITILSVLSPISFFMQNLPSNLVCILYGGCVKDGFQADNLTARRTVDVVRDIKKYLPQGNKTYYLHVQYLSRLMVATKTLNYF